MTDPKAFIEVQLKDGSVARMQFFEDPEPELVKRHIYKMAMALPSPPTGWSLTTRDDIAAKIAAQVGRSDT
jgi:hypothetical protein